jgi:predicted Rossmann fold nucleotide-binding protein DprA/Smf involved in DNA uptake
VRTSTRKEYRDHLLRGNLTLLTPYSPEAGFSAGNAMGRNRLIYCLSGAAVAVCSAPGKGGTFTGASESLNRGWVPVWTVPNDDPASGNTLLIAKGAGALPPLAELDVKALFDGALPSRQPDTSQTSFIG